MQLERDHYQRQRTEPGFSQYTPYIFGVCAVASLWLVRPTVFGEVFSFYGSALMIIVSIGGIIFNIHRGAPPMRTDLRSILFLLYILHSAILIAIFGHKNGNEAIKEILIMIATLSLWVVMRSRFSWAQKTFDILSYSIVIFSSSMLITYIMTAMGVRYNSIIMGQFHYTYPPPAGNFLFPFSMMYNQTESLFGVVPRFTGSFRESGIFPAFACWAAYFHYARGRGAKYSWLCLLAGIGSGSSLGLPLAGLTAFCILVSAFRVPLIVQVVVAPFAAAGAFAITYNIPYLGLAYKIEKFSSSFTDRYLSVLNAIDNASIFGHGYTSGMRYANINLIASTESIGIFGFVLLMSIYGVAIRDARYFAGALLPMLITLLLSQPIGATAMVLFIFLSAEYSRRSQSVAQVGAKARQGRRGTTPMTGIIPANPMGYRRR